jgi:uncharacterized membrane protein YbhN (UPF0104 family)
LRRPLAIFSSIGDEERRRRPADVFAVVFGIAIVVTAIVDRGHPTIWLGRLTDFLLSLPEWVQSVFGGFMVLGAIYIVLIIVVAVAAAERQGLVRDMAAGAILAIAALMITGWLVERSWPAWDSILGRGGAHFPVTRVGLLTALILIASPYVIRPVRRLGQFFVFAAVIGSLALGLGSTAQTFGGFGVGFAVAAAVHFVFGSPAGAPSLYHVQQSLLAAGVDVTALRRMRDTQPGSLTLSAEDAHGDLLTITVQGRDAVDTQLLAKAWRFLWYRDSSPFIVGRLHQVEHEAVMNVLAEQAGARTHGVAAMSATERGDAVLVLRPVPDVAALVCWDESQVTDAWRQLAKLRNARIAHGALDQTSFVADQAGRVVLEQFATAEISASDDQLQQDAAALLVLTAMSVGVSTAIDAALASIGSDALADVVPHIQPAALTQTLRRAVKRSKFDIDDLRASIALRLEIEEPALVQIHRVTPRNLVITGITVLGFWFVISRLADVDYAALWDALEHASWGWIVVALLLSQVARIAQAVSTMGAARHKLGLGPTTAMQFAITFTNVAVPSTAARIAMEMRYFQKQGAPQAEALAAGALDSLSGFIGQLIILLITLGFGASSIEFDWSRFSIDIDIRRIGLFAALLFAAGLVSLFVVKRLRQWIRRFLSEAFGALRGLNSARRLLMLFGGNMAGEVLFASALGASALALGYHLSLADLMAINVLVGLFAGLMPLPSIGVTEAAIAFGLTAAGLPETDALAAALLYRCTTFYFPPIWGYVALRWLTKNDYL